MFRDKEIFHVKNHKGENESMQEQTRTPVFQNSDGTWGHLTKTVNPLICTIEYGSSTGFSSKEEAEKKLSEIHGLLPGSSFRAEEDPQCSFYFFRIPGLLDQRNPGSGIQWKQYACPGPMGGRSDHSAAPA